MGRLGGDQKNQEYNRELSLLAAPETPLFGTEYALFLGDFTISLIFRKSLDMLKISKAVWYGGILVVLKMARLAF